LIKSETIFKSPFLVTQCEVAGIFLSFNWFRSSLAFWLFQKRIVLFSFNVTPCISTSSSSAAFFLDPFGLPLGPLGSCSSSGVFFNILFPFLLVFFLVLSAHWSFFDGKLLLLHALVLAIHLDGKPI
jgi:hypothetical protein